MGLGPTAAGWWIAQSHAALAANAAHSTGLLAGFDTPVCALALTLAVTVIYVGTGIRRQACIHAEFINRIFRSMVKGKRSQEEQLREVLGHTPLEARAGTLLGIGVAQLIWFLW